MSKLMDVLNKTTTEPGWEKFKTDEECVSFLNALVSIIMFVLGDFRSKLIDAIDRIQSNHIGYDVFLSHSKYDNEYTDALKAALDEYHLNPFYDRSSIMWGDDFTQDISNALKTSRCAFFVISKDFMESKYACSELKKFYKLNRHNVMDTIYIIRHNVSQEEINQKFPFVKSIQTKDSGEHSISSLAFDFAEIYSKLHGVECEGKT